MEIRFETEVSKENGKDKYNVTSASPKFCCEEMEQAWDAELVEESIHWNVNLTSPVRIVLYFKPVKNVYGDLEGDSCSKEIRFCPFCGKQITFRETKRVRLIRETIIEFQE